MLTDRSFEFKLSPRHPLLEGMNRTQITIIWLLLTALLPSAYFVVSRGLLIEDRLKSNRKIREIREQSTNETMRFLVEADHQGKSQTFEIRSDHFPTNDEEALKLIPAGRQLSEQEATAWGEKDSIHLERKRFWELSIVGLCVLTSCGGLLLYRAKANGNQ